MAQRTSCCNATLWPLDVTLRQRLCQTDVEQILTNTSRTLCEILYFESFLHCTFFVVSWSINQLLQILTWMCDATKMSYGNGCFGFSHSFIHLAFWSFSVVHPISSNQFTPLGLLLKKNTTAVPVSVVTHSTSRASGTASSCAVQTYRYQCDSHDLLTAASTFQ